MIAPKLRYSYHAMRKSQGKRQQPSMSNISSHGMDYRRKSSATVTLDLPPSSRGNYAEHLASPRTYPRPITLAQTANLNNRTSGLNNISASGLMSGRMTGRNSYLWWNLRTKIGKAKQHESPLSSPSWVITPVLVGLIRGLPSHRS
jgi:hypothetical protein